MATHTSGLAPDPRCPECGGRLDTNVASRGGLLATVALGDIAVNVLAGLFVIAGFFWELAWLAALGLAVFAIVRKAMRHPHYRCIDCKREFTYSAIYGAK